MAESSGSADPGRTRDHLANERTYLAWLRTAATVMVVGLAIAKFASDEGRSAVTAGGLLVLVGASGLVYGTVRYRRAGQAIDEGRGIAAGSGTGPVVASAVLLVALLVAFLLLLTST